MSGQADAGLTVEQRLEKLRNELDALQRIKTQEDYDEGNRLHELHNAPWRKGQYSHLEFPTYVYREFPRMLYGLKYEEATAARDLAQQMPAGSIELDNRRKDAIARCEKYQRDQTKIVHSERELRALPANTWFLKPEDAVAHVAKLQKEIEVQAAHRAHDDRRMTGRAAEERDAYDEAAEDFVAEIPRTKIKPKGRRVRTAR